ncbi:hypothetical protein CLOM_g24144 [Closterium sp. NIES-68]|nr:hypothetical protein CLOM_g24144 [Closterium sp. NIES-68]GJP74108.1 hypothetical protein CLOP_g4742 [Closterium sp. NIES-67]
MECFLAIPSASHTVARSVARASLVVSHTSIASSRSGLPSKSIPSSPIPAAAFAPRFAGWRSRSRLSSEAIWTVHQLPQEGLPRCGRRVAAGRGRQGEAEGRGEARRFVTRASAEGSIGGDGRDEVSSRLGRGSRRSGSDSNSGSSSTSESESSEERVAGARGGIGSSSDSESDDGVSEGSPPQDVLLKAVSEVSRMAGRQARTTNMVLGGTASEYGDDWLELDKKVNTYPSLREFTAIGSGGGDFAVAMVLAVQSVIPTDTPELQVVTRESATGRYISVKIGPVRMDSSEQVRAVYQAMKQDPRMRYFL